MLIDILKADMIAAMKSKSILELSVIRSLISDINKKQLDSKSAAITDDMCLSVILKADKQRDESIMAYKNGNREDLMMIEQNEKNIIAKYMPSFLSEDDTKIAINKLIESLSVKNIGTIMKAVRDIPNVNMAVASKLVKEIMS